MKPWPSRAPLHSPLLYKPDPVRRQNHQPVPSQPSCSLFLTFSGRPLHLRINHRGRSSIRETSTAHTMDRFILAFLLLLLASAAAVEGRMVRSVFDDGKPMNRSGVRLLIGPDACQRTCDQVRFKAICRGLAKLPGVSTPRQLLLASMRVAAQKAKEAKARVEAYGARSHEGGPMVSIISTCRKGYDDVAQSLEETRALIEAQGTQFVGFNSKVSDALTSASDCDTAFEDFPDIPSPFAAVQKNVFRVVDNVLNIAVVVQQAEAQLPNAHVPQAH
ncbi:hypothetical protein SETIT_3G161800v2 [Setaria italica]|uniref:Pectinesterase inhibitor domain-containing protein n=1 Tax=Setaria italica TaxID=4555 RepID=A0A368QFI3_SETIT|nr:uncharacterized protein LOC101757532 [Setaria italica]RCV16731.1 hypothetical protein SETIT_3G161800v2 [Setaria italica]